MTETNGHRKVRVIPAPRQPVAFTDVTNLLRAKQPAEGFTRVAEILLDRFEDLAPIMGAAAVIKLAIDTHKHGLFCEVAADKTRTAHDAAAFDLYQKYLSGDSDIPVAAGMPITTPVNQIDVDLEVTADGETEQHRQ